MTKPPSMYIWPWAKLTTRMMLKTMVSPSAMSAQAEPRMSPLMRICSMSVDESSVVASMSGYCPHQKGGRCGQWVKQTIFTAKLLMVSLQDPEQVVVTYYFYYLLLCFYYTRRTRDNVWRGTTTRVTTACLVP